MKKKLVCAFALLMVVLTGCQSKSDTDVDVSTLTPVERYVVETYKENGKSISMDDLVLVDDAAEADVKIANIKEYNDAGSLTFSKLIFKWDETAETGTVIYLMLEDKVVIDNQ